MKKSIILFVFITTIISAQQIKPQIFSPNPEHDFGNVIEGNIVEHEYEIENRGNAILRLSFVRASCGCTAAQPTKRELLPGEKTTIKVQYDSHGRKGFEQKYVYVFSNDADNKQYVLTFKVNVVENDFNPSGNNVPKMELEKQRIDFGKVKEGVTVNSKIDFKNVGTGILEIKNIRTTCGCTAAVLSSKRIEPNKSGTISIELDTTNREGLLTRTVTLFTNDPIQPNQVITITANIEKGKL